MIIKINRKEDKDESSGDDDKESDYSPASHIGFGCPKGNEREQYPKTSVVEKDKLVGIVTKHNLLEATPLPPTSVSIHDLDYLLSKMKVKEIIKKNPITITPDTPFEDGLRIGQEKKNRLIPRAGRC